MSTIELEPKTFFKIIAEDKYLIEIPRIQRDFAQGRVSLKVNRIRKQFLASLYDALNNECHINLDFVYGYTENQYKFIPLDGQQRLTTLFLLHWYVALKENRDLTQLKDKFSYKTRVSSTDFCEKLLEHKLNYTELKNSNKAKYEDEVDKDVSEWIKDQSWYLPNWDYDPTIQSMLVMLDYIHDKFKSMNNLWEKLTGGKPLIQFHFLNLNDANLKQDIYITMNSRGKQLTDFEHLKAHLEELIKETDNDQYLIFAQSIDNEWADIFWKYRDEGAYIVDNKILNYIGYVTKVLALKQQVYTGEDIFDTAKKVYGKDTSKAKSNIAFLISAFNCWINLDNKRPIKVDEFFGDIFVASGYADGKVSVFPDKTGNYGKNDVDFFHYVVSRKIDNQNEANKRKWEFKELLIFYAIIEYRINNIDEKSFTKRIRNVRNILFNSSDELRKDKLKDQLEEVYAIVVENALDTVVVDDPLIKKTSFNGIIVTDERNKNKFIEENPELAQVLYRLEDNRHLQGNTTIIKRDNPDKFKEYAQAFENIFNEKPEYLKITKTLLTYDDKFFSVGKYHWFRKDERGWRDILQKKYVKDDNKKSVFAKLLEAASKSEDLCVPNSICEEYLKQNTTAKLFGWIYYFVKYFDIRFGAGYLYIQPSEMAILILNGSHTNSKSLDPFIDSISDNKLYENTDHEKWLEINDLGIKIKNIKEGFEIIDINGSHQEALANYKKEGEESKYILSVSQKDAQPPLYDEEDRIEMAKKCIRTLRESVIT